MKRVNYHLTEQQIARLKELSERTGLSVADLIRRFVDVGLDKVDKESKKRQEGR